MSAGMETPRQALTLPHLLAQSLLFGAFALVIGVFSRWPAYQVLAPERAVVKVSFTHHGKPVSECRQRSAAELAKLPPHMRAPVQCPRERSPVVVEVDVDGQTVYRYAAQPSGLSRDGASAVYQRIELPAGPHEFTVRMNDDARQSGFNHQRTGTFTLAPAQILVIDFDAQAGGVTFK
jgi:hypothetical protein